jgi:hypothetical protein
MTVFERHGASRSEFQCITERFGAGRGAIAHEDSELHGSDEVNSPDQKKKRLREGDVGPEMRSPAGFSATFLRKTVQPVKRRSGNDKKGKLPYFYKIEKNRNLG